MFAWFKIIAYLDISTHNNYLKLLIYNIKTTD